MSQYRLLGIWLWAAIGFLPCIAFAQGECLFTETGRIQAEDACDFPGTVDSNHAGYTGTGFVNTTNAVGSHIEWNLALPAGTYYAHFRYANAAGAARGGALELDGVQVGGSIPFEDTGAWTNWRRTDAYAFTVDGAEAALRLVAETDGGLANIDFIEIHPSATILTTLTVDGGGGDGTYGLNSVVLINADEPVGNQQFLRWEGDVASVDDVFSSVTTIAMIDDLTVAASFEEVLTGPYSIRMAESIMRRNPAVFGPWDYQTGTVLRGFEELWMETGDRDYFDYIKSTVDDVVGPSGVIENYNPGQYSIDEIKEGDLLLLLDRETTGTRYRAAAESLRMQIANQPRTNSGGFWHRDTYANQMWLDGLYMAEPFYCEYGEMFDEPENFDDVAFQLIEMYVNTYDTSTGLMFHGWDESGNASWADPVTGRSPVFWARSMGWYVMAIVDVLDHLPTDHDERKTLIEILRDVCAGLLAARDPADGVWWQVPDHPGEGNNYQEASGGLMYLYAFSKGARLGYLDESYRTVAEQSFQDHIDEFITEHPDGTVDLTDTCIGTGVGGTLTFYYNRPVATNDTKGIGPFMMAGAEVELREMAPLYDLVVEGGFGGGKYLAGREVRVRAYPANDDAVFLGWSGNVHFLENSTTTSTRLTMPAAGVSLRAVFSDSTASNPAWKMLE